MPLRGRTILIVEDSDLVRGLIKELLGAADVRILEASSGAEAIAVAANEQGADLLITDLSLPGGSGIEPRAVASPSVAWLKDAAHIR